MKQAVLLLAHGAPERIEDIPEYLTLVRGGRSTAPEIVEEVKRRYAAMGGSSPLNARTREQAEALQARLGIPVYTGMRNWRPPVIEAVKRMKADGIERAVALPLAPHRSKASTGLYVRRAEEACREAGFSGELVWTRSFFDHPLFIEALAERLAQVLPAERVLFTAHSLPERALDANDPYVHETRATASLVAARCGLPRMDFAYQSQSFTNEAWLGPAVEDVLDGYAAEGVRDVALQPVGFVCDHLEILYDIDIAFRGYARERGIELRRPESLNAYPTFIAALVAIAEEALCGA